MAVTYLLDTGILVGYVRDADYTKYIDEHHQPRAGDNIALVSIVSHGEIFSCAYQFGWGSKKRDRLKRILQKFSAQSINHQDIIDRYAEIDAFSKGKLPDESLSHGMSSITMGKNDIWIAATASIIDATLLTTDTDFDHVHGVYLDRVYFDPDGEYQ